MFVLPHRAFALQTVVRGDRCRLAGTRRGALLYLVQKLAIPFSVADGFIFLPSVGQLLYLYLVEILFLGGTGAKEISCVLLDDVGEKDPHVRHLGD